MAKHSASILELAKRGATARFEELQAEIHALAKHFPHLRKGGKKTPFAGGAQFAGEASPITPPKRKRRKMSAAQKKAIGARMKKYWAAKRKAAAKE